jgi:DNA-binding PadR family transcriptional regulator
MPARSSDLPNHFERSILQKLRLGNELPLTKLPAPAGRTTIQKLLEKGWIERGRSSRSYRITELGIEALTAQMPIERRRDKTVEMEPEGERSNEQ